MPPLDDFKAFDVAAASVSLWVFKGPKGRAGNLPTYTAHWVRTTDDLDTALKETITAERDRIEEVLDYGLLAQNNEHSALSIGTDETHAGLLTELVTAEVPSRQVTDATLLQNVSFYLVKLVHDNRILYAVRRTTRTWKTSRRRSVRSLIFHEHQLGVNPDPHFELESAVDFFVLGQDLLILHKGHFESTLSYRQAHADDFGLLQGDTEFSSVFEGLHSLIQHVGANKIRLRRMSAVRQKGHFRDARFMDRLRQYHGELGFTFQFSPDGRIVATEETSSHIITALLDHRLTSPISQRTYEVPSAAEIAVAPAANQTGTR